MTGNERPLARANITRLRLLFRDCKAEAGTLEEIRDELRRRRTSGAKQLLKLVEKELNALAGAQAKSDDDEKPEPRARRHAGQATVEAPVHRVLTLREAAAQKRIAELRSRLLDLSNANRLLNYRFSARSRRQVRLVDELPDQILAKLQEGRRLVFKSLPEPGDEPADEKSDVFLLALEQARRSDEQYLQALDDLGDDEEGEATRRIECALRDRVRETLRMPIRRTREQISKTEWAAENGIEPSFDLPQPARSKERHLDADIQTLLLPDEMERTLSAIRDQARSALQETGINTLYLAFGFLEWFEASTAQTPMFAPLLLHPVDLDRTIVSGKYRYTLGSLGEETELNITLSERLYQDFHRRLPELEEDDTPEAYFRKVTATIDDLPRWRVRRFGVLGHFAFARLVMFHDLDPSHWPDGLGVIANPVVGALFAGSGTASDAYSAEDYEVDEPAIASKVPLLITDADSSQFSAIADVMDGKNLAIKGPPGTGKSQTITNIIAAAMKSQKTVLFVAEKMAALNVVKDRLEKAGLAHFCLELHSTKARKKDLLETLDQRLAIQGGLRARGDLSSAVAERERIRDQLSEYVATINRRFGATGKTIHDILWSEQRTRLTRDSLPKALDEEELTGAKHMTRHRFAALRGRLDVLAAAYADATAESGTLDKNPWFGVSNAALDYFGRERLLQEMSGLQGALEQLRRVLDGIAAALQIPPLEKIVDAEGLSIALERLPNPAPHLDSRLYVALSQPEAFKAIDAFQQAQATWLDARRQLAKLVADPDRVMHRNNELDEAVSLAAELSLPSAHLSDLQLSDLPARATFFLNAAKEIEQVILFGRRLARAFVADPVLTPDAISKLLAAARHAASFSRDLAPMRHPALADEGASHVLMEAREPTTLLQRKMAPLAEHFTFSLDGQVQQWRVHSEALRSSRFPFGLWRKDVRAAKARYKELLRAPRRVRRHKMASHFEEIAQCDELALNLRIDSTLKAVCGPHFKGSETPFDQLIEVSSYMVSVRGAFVGENVIDERVRRQLLEGSTVTLAEIASLGRDPEAFKTEKTLADIPDPEEDLVTFHTTVSNRAEKIARLANRTLAIGLKPELRIGSLAHLAEIVASGREAEAAIQANSDAREVLGDLWVGTESDRSVIMNALHATSAVDEANLPEPIRKYLFHGERDLHAASLKDWRAQLESARDDTYEK